MTCECLEMVVDVDAIAAIIAAMTIAAIAVAVAEADLVSAVEAAAGLSLL